MPKRQRAQQLVHRLVESPKSQFFLVWLSFLEAVIVPIPLEAVLVPYMQLRRDIVWRIAALALLGFIVASGLGYLVGLLAFNTIGTFIIESFGWQQDFQRIQELFGQYGFWALFGIGLLPIPSQVAMLAGGAFGYSVPLFVLAMGLSRGLRYFGLAVLVVWLGNSVSHHLALWQAWARRHRKTAALIAVVIIGVIGYLWWRP